MRYFAFIIIAPHFDECSRKVIQTEYDRLTEYVIRCVERIPYSVFRLTLGTNLLSEKALIDNSYFYSVIHW